MNRKESGGGFIFEDEAYAYLKKWDEKPFIVQAIASIMPRYRQRRQDAARLLVAVSAARYEALPAEERARREAEADKRISDRVDSLIDSLRQPDHEASEDPFEFPEPPTAA